MYAFVLFHPSRCPSCERSFHPFCLCTDSYMCFQRPTSNKNFERKIGSWKIQTHTHTTNLHQNWKKKKIGKVSVDYDKQHILQIWLYVFSGFFHKFLDRLCVYLHTTNVCGTPMWLRCESDRLMCFEIENQQQYQQRKITTATIITMQKRRASKGDEKSNNNIIITTCRTQFYYIHAARRWICRACTYLVVPLFHQTQAIAWLPLYRVLCSTVADKVCIASSRACVALCVFGNHDDASAHSFRALWITIDWLTP